MADFTFARILEGSQKIRRESKSTVGKMLELHGSFGGDCGSASGPSDSRGVNFENFWYAVGGDSLHVKSLVKLFDRDRRLSLRERMFLPSQLRRHLSQHGSGDVDNSIHDQAVSSADPLGDSGPQLQSRPRSESEELGLIRAEMIRLGTDLKVVQTQLQREREHRASAEAALFEEVSRVTSEVSRWFPCVNRLEALVDSHLETQCQHKQQLETKLRDDLHELQCSMQTELMELRTLVFHQRAQVQMRMLDEMGAGTYDIDEFSSCDKKLIQQPCQTVSIETRVGSISPQTAAPTASGGMRLTGSMLGGSLSRCPKGTRFLEDNLDILVSSPENDVTNQRHRSAGVDTARTQRWPRSQDSRDSSITTPSSCTP